MIKKFEKDVYLKSLYYATLIYEQAALLVFIEEKREKRVNSNEEKLAYPVFFFKNAKVFCQASTVSFGA
jgi:hypothetical protein